MSQFATRNVRVRTMATTIEQAVNPLLMTYSILGIGVCSSSKLYLSILYNLIIWIAYGCLYYYSVAALKAERWFQTVINIVHIRIGILATITSTIVGVYQDKRFRIFMKRLAAVDDTLEELGTPKLYQKMHTYAKRVIVVWLACSHTANVFDMIWWLYAMENHWCMILPYIVNHYQHVNMFVDFLFMTFLWYIGTQFDKINKHMRCLMKKEHGLKYTTITIATTRRYIMNDNYYKRTLWILMHLHLELCQIARELNAMFGPQVTIEMIAYLINLVRLCNFIIIHMLTKSRYMIAQDWTQLFTWIGLHFWVSMHMARLFYLNYVCENVSAKANEMKRIIHQLTDNFRYIDVRDEIYQFALQIIRHPLKFTGMGLFYFGNGLLRKFFITMTTFMIFVIQMAIIPKDSVKRE